MGLKNDKVYNKKESFEEFDESLYKNLKLYIKDTDNISLTNLPEFKNINKFLIYDIISNFQKKEKSLFLRGDELILNYFLCEDKSKFESKIFIKQNIKITNDFRYFGLYFYFGNPEKFMINFYLELFLNVNKILGGAIHNNDMDQKAFFLNLKVLNSSIPWIIIIPCFHFPLTINEIEKLNHVHSILVHCHGKHDHKEDYFKSFLKYKGLFTTHNELMNKLKLINEGYTIPLFNYSFESKNNYEKYNFSLGPNIKSKIKNNLRNLYENNYLLFDMTYNCNASKQLIFKAYLYYKNIKEEKINVNNPEELLFCKDFIDIEDDMPLNEKINFCKEFIPKLYLVCYYYLSYYYSNPFKMPIDEVKENTKSTDENNKSLLYKNNKRRKYFDKKYS